ncbi:MAG: M42 family metallopeptidase [Puniceicoccales bacterium]|jgi:endoglucanase|nr:M42 family metallopeptidase [Puniceicoccales bacterium]
MEIPNFLKELVEARAPSGYEFEAQQVIDRHMSTTVDSYTKDVLGSRYAALNPQHTCQLMFMGHMDELGFAIHYIDEKGFLFFDRIGGHDVSIIPGRHVCVLTRKGIVNGVTGKRAVHLMDEEERKKVPKLYDLWIDIGAKSESEALELVQIGDPIIYADTVENLSGNLISGRAFDDKAGTYAVMEALKRLSAEKHKLSCGVTSVASVQEEVGVRGAITASYMVAPRVGIAVDVGHATDFPSCDAKRFGKFSLGSGPLIARGCNINPLVFEKLIACAEEKKIPYQVATETYPTGTDARAIQMTRRGIATGLVSIPLRYMHTPVETIHLEDLENVVRLLVAFAQSLQENDRFEF